MTLISCSSYSGAWKGQLVFPPTDPLGYFPYARLTVRVRGVIMRVIPGARRLVTPKFFFLKTGCRVWYALASIVYPLSQIVPRTT